MAIEGLEAPIASYHEWADIPHFECFIHCVGKEVPPIMTQADPCDSVNMAQKGKFLRIISFDIPRFDLVIQSSVENVLVCVTEASSSCLVI